MSQPRIESWTVEPAWAWLRVDIFLALQMHWRSRRWLVERLDQGKVRVNGQPTKKARRLAVGDVVALEVPPPDVAPDDLGAIPLHVLFEDADLVVVDKPSNLAVHAASPCHHRNLLARVRHRYRHEVVDDRASPAIVHRLDRSTTGVIAFARRAELVPFYMAQFERRSVRKHYFALVHGVPADTGTIDLPLLLRPGATVVVDDRGKPCRTEWEVVERAPAAAMLRISLHTGRKHQIRVHLAAIGHPILYDDRYGRLHEQSLWPPDCGPQLHASRLELDHTDHRRMVFEAPLPEAMSLTWQEQRASPIGS